jgi:hypothetical protein
MIKFFAFFGALFIFIAGSNAQYPNHFGPRYLQGYQLM